VRKMLKLSKFNRNIIKYGLAATAGGSVAAYVTGKASAEIGRGDEAGSKSAKAAAMVGLGITAAVVGRKYVGKGLKVIGSKMESGDHKVIFRRFRGRIVPIKIKK
jgi:hypothetical protein